LDTDRLQLLPSEGSEAPRSPHRSGRAACWRNIGAMNALML
jgi:hypothetical protein